MRYVERDVLMNLTHFVERECSHPKHKNRIGAGAPSPPKCRAASLDGQSLLSLCLATTGECCGFASSLGDNLLCYHPERDRIVKRTLARQARRRAAASGGRK